MDKIFIENKHVLNDAYIVIQTDRFYEVSRLLNDYNLCPDSIKVYKINGIYR